MTHGLVISGGGAFASYAVGVVRALLCGESNATNYEPLVPHAISGTSGGGFTAAAATCKLGEGALPAVEFMEDVWLNRIASTLFTTCGNGVFRLRGNPTNYLDPACYVPNPFRPLMDLARDTGAFAREGLRRVQHVVLESETAEQRILEQFSFEPLVDVAPYGRLVRDVIDYGAIRSSPVKLSINATNWDRGTVRYFTNPDFGDETGALIISAAGSIPGIFPPHEIEGEHFVDGSVLVNSPLRVIIRQGVDDIHVITHLPLDERRPWPHFANLPEVLWRLQEIKWVQTLRSDIEFARGINDGLTILEEHTAGLAPTHSITPFLLQLSRSIQQRKDEGRPYTKLNIHIHHPHDPLGGFLGFLDFEKDTIAQHIQRGYQDTLNHDCKLNGCVLVDRDEASPRTNADDASDVH